MNKITIITSVSIFLIIAGCASRQTQGHKASSEQSKQELTTSIYLAGGYGESSDTDDQDRFITPVLAGSEQSVIFLGDNITPKSNSESDYKLMKIQATAASYFKGKAWSIPGNYEWKAKDTKRNIAIGDTLSLLTGNKNFWQPQDGCPISHQSLNDKLEIIFIDSQWYIGNWDKIKGINENCPHIKNRRRFIEEIEDLIKANSNKNIIIAMHHPIFSNGKHAGEFSFKDHLSPLPIAGTLALEVRRLGGTNPQDMGSTMYLELAWEIAALAKLSDRIIIVSGHEKSLQYLQGGGIHQIISGSLSKGEATKLSKGNITALGGNLEYSGVYSSSEVGYAKLNYFNDGSAALEFYRLKSNDLLYRQNILPPLPKADTNTNSPIIPKNEPITNVSVLSEKETKKSWFYKVLWGQHYRDYYSLPISAKTAFLDTLYGGVKILKEGGGHQSQSLRLSDKDGNQYAMRSLKKNAMKFLRFKIKGTAFAPQSYENTEAEQMVADFFTTSHPYAQLAVSDLADKAKVNHSNVKLYYFPEQQGFQNLNDLYKNSLYFVEERPGGKNKTFAGYQFATEEKDKPVKEFFNTQEVLEKLRTNEGFSIDQRQYIRSRLFDMLIGDWDRHEDQWRWAFRETGKNSGVFSPIPRDRDAAFAKFDGVALGVIKLNIPETRFWQTYRGDISSVKWFNSEAYSLDKIVLDKAGNAMWKEEAESLQESLSPDIIDNAFKNLPLEVQDPAIENIKMKLKERLTKMPSIAERYANYINKTTVVYATENDDQILIERMTGGRTKIEIAKKMSKEVYYSNIFNFKETKEILLYGLNGSDLFIVQGSGDHHILVRMIGGYGDDSYQIAAKTKTKVYDYKYEQSTFEGKMPAKKQLTNSYQTNTLDYRYFTQNSNVLVPAIGFATDDGLFIGARETYTKRGFNGSPYRQLHKFMVNYFTQYDSGELGYQGVFANQASKINLEIGGYYSGEKFSNNFFGYGNQSVNGEDTYDKDYNRAHTRQVHFNAGPSYKFIKIAAIYESFEVEDNPERYFTPDNISEDVFKKQQYIGGETTISYTKRNAEDFATSGLYAESLIGYKSNVQDNKNHFTYLSGKIGFDQKLTTQGNLVLQSTMAGKIIFGDNFNFYHAASIGGDNGLRGFRNERFSGDSYFYQSTNLKVRIGQIRTGFLPLDFGIYGGFDYGRVWLDNEDSRKWHISQGGGLWFGGLQMTSIQTGFFNSVEGNIFFFGFNFKY